MSQTHKILHFERENETLILVPRANGFGFRYADVQSESNAVRRVLDDPDVRSLVVDLGSLDYFGSELIGAIVALARHVSDCGGRAVMCNASEKMLDVLATMRLSKLWPYFATRAEALEAVRD